MIKQPPTLIFEMVRKLKDAINSSWDHSDDKKSTTAASTAVQILFAETLAIYPERIVEAQLELVKMHIDQIKSDEREKGKIKMNENGQMEFEGMTVHE